MASDGNQFELFISYSRADIDAADILVAALEEAGFGVKIDRRDLPYGEEWQKELAGFIHACDTVIWLVSPDSVRSRWCNWELGEVGRIGKRLMPVAVRPVDPDRLPEALGRIHLLPPSGAFDAAIHFPALVTALRTDGAWLKQGTRLADRAFEWRSRSRDPGLLLRGAALREAERWSSEGPRSAPAPQGEVLELILASKKGASRRQRTVLAGALAVAVVASGLATVAWLQYSTAKRNFDMSITAAERLAIGLAGDLRQLAGVPTDRIDGMLKRAEELYATMIAAGGETERLVRSRSWLQREMARTYERLGELDKARQNTSASIASARQMLSATPSDRRAKEALLEGLILRQNIERRIGRIAEMKTAAEEAVEVSLAIVRDHYDIPAVQSFAKASRLLWQNLLQFDGKRAQEALDARLEVMRKLTTSFPDDVDVLSVAADAEEDLAGTHWRDNDLARAQDAYFGVIGLWRRIVALDDRPLLRSGLLRGLQRYADVSSLDRKHDAALKAETEALQMIRESVAKEPYSYQVQLDLAFGVSRLAKFQLSVDPKAQVDGLYDEAIRVTREMLRQDSANIENQTRLVQALIYIARDCIERRRREQGLQAAREAIEFARKIARRVPDDVQISFTLATSLPVLALLEERQTGIELLSEAMRTVSDLLAKGVIDARYRAFVENVESLRARASAGEAWPLQMPVADTPYGTTTRNR